MQNKFFPEIKGKFGFGMMRLPLIGDKVDFEQTNKMVDEFIEKGFNYFDTAHGYLNGQSEVAVNQCLTSRYPREKYLLADKLTNGLFEKSEEGIRKFFMNQLEICGVEYFDFYLMHAQNSAFFEEFKKCKAYETAFSLKKEGKIHHVGISFHDRADVLDRILTEYPEVEFVQIQFNYLDYNSAGIQSRLCYEVCQKHNKPVVVMEPVKGGTLANLPDDAKAVLDALDQKQYSYASYAIRFAAGFPQMMVVLSGMSSTEQMSDNLSFMSDFKPLSEKELQAIDKVCELYSSKHLIACTACRYCVAGCPKKILIPNLFADMNMKTLIPADWNSEWYYMVHTQECGKASDCIKCGKCERVCPQHLPVRALLEKVAATFEKKA